MLSRGGGAGRGWEGPQLPFVIPDRPVQYPCHFMCKAESSGYDVWSVKEF